MAASAVPTEIYNAVYNGFFPECIVDLEGLHNFDVVYFNDVLEHLPDAESALSAARDLLNANGTLIASIPNVRHISVLGQLVFRGEFRYRETGILDRTHLRFYTRRSMTRMFEESGWRVEHVQGINRGLRVGDQKVPALLRLLSVLTRGYINDFLFVQYVVVAKAR